MFCPKCGKPVGDDAHFCQDCGCPLSRTTEKKEFKQKTILSIVLGVVALFGVVFFIDTVALNGVLFGIGGSASSFEDDNDRKREDSDKEEEENVDKTDKLKQHLKENGDLRTYQKTYSGDYAVYKLSYDEDKDDVSISCVELADVEEEEVYSYSYEQIKCLTTICVNNKSGLAKAEWYYHVTENSTYVASGNIDKSVFSKSNDTIDNVRITGLVASNHYDITKSLFVGDVSSALEQAQKLLNEADIGVSLSDLGFVNY